MEKGSESRNKGVAWLSTSDEPTLKQLVKLHFSMFAYHMIAVQIMAFPTEDEYEEAQENKENLKVQKKVMKMSLN